MMRARKERGGVATLLILVLMLAAAAIGLIALRGPAADLRAGGQMNSGRTTFYCTESALQLAKGYYNSPSNAVLWNQFFAANPQTGPFNNPSAPIPAPVLPYPFTYTDPVAGSVATVYIMDDMDEMPAVNNPNADQNRIAILVAQCTENGITRTVRTVIQNTGNGPGGLRQQAGQDQNHDGNVN
jgi:hypothetical protein